MYIGINPSLWLAIIKWMNKSDSPILKYSGCILFLLTCIQKSLFHHHFDSLSRNYRNPLWRSQGRSERFCLKRLSTNVVLKYSHGSTMLSIIVCNVHKEFYGFFFLQTIIYRKKNEMKWNKIKRAGNWFIVIGNNSNYTAIGYNGCTAFKSA